MTVIEKARRTSGISQSGAAALLGMSWPTYIKREREPERLTVAEFLKLYGEFDGDGKAMLRDWIAAKL